MEGYIVCFFMNEHMKFEIWLADYKGILLGECLWREWMVIKSRRYDAERDKKTNENCKRLLSLYFFYTIIYG